MSASETREPVIAYIGIGSNLQDPLAQVGCALQELEGLPRSRCTRASGLYRSPPMGPPSQPDYINAVVGLKTRLAPQALLRELQTIERRHGRRRGVDRWGPRTLDLDLLLYGELMLESEGLIIPHPGLVGRNFVLYPLLELGGDIPVPGHGPVVRLAEACPRGGLVRLG
jgi:2-amino-4-hydroxy-6-hydroxymethyldihydropteridine diphosphokinase